MIKSKDGFTIPPEINREKYKESIQNIEIGFDEIMEEIDKIKDEETKNELKEIVTILKRDVKKLKVFSKPANN
ncbi:hypothetical protein [Natranaerobius thermophilus]|uniref:Uncharacterized protein n=1 Tax=Natranaerobius thermophilus (strain ATCC BAA-1301 / DSM 18059 / JW/NM-WN-LF) TaxID=457570 RepID=B2A222_NATTJ|nr:hypothetical protein [Natranaerobius thermophilus]ACB84827.1 hypothetical protein Nther_1244 [Natranaerobius thermophilus JW/NM-WN-LF]